MVIYLSPYLHFKHGLLYNVLTSFYITLVDKSVSVCLHAYLGPPT